MIRSAVAAFYARKDTATPVKASLTGLAVNVLLKVVLMGSLAQVGLALATATGAWINLLLVLGFAVRAGYLDFDRGAAAVAGKFAVSGVVLAAALVVCGKACGGAVCALGTLRDEAVLLVLIGVGAIVYGGSILLLFGRGWLRSLVRQLNPLRFRAIRCNMAKNPNRNWRYDGSHQIRRRSKRAAQGRRRAHSRQGPLYRRPRAVGLAACAGAALAACAREIHHRCERAPAGCRAWLRS